jgi:kanamycin kinase
MTGVDDALAALRSRFARHEWIPVTDGMSGARVWRLRGPSECYLKVAGRSAHPGFDPRAEAVRLEWLAAHGIPVPAVIDLGGDADVGWLVTAAAPGRSAAHPWPPEQHDAVIDAWADVTRALHALPVEHCPFERSLDVRITHARHAVDAALVDLDDLDDERAGWTGTQLLAELEATRPAVEELVVCHGDLCLPNVLLDPHTVTVTGLIDVGGLGRADRYADLALATRSLADDDLNPQFGPGAADRFLARYGEVEVHRDRLAFYRLLDEFF